jgi:tetratricopeptide (TPR) repeat protein
MLRACCSFALGLAIFVLARTARADRITDAEDLFRRAKALSAQGMHREACPLYAESYRLDPGTGTLLNLAMCHEQIGWTASAWGEFRAVEQQARVATPPNESRVKLARDRADKLEPRLARIRITIPRASRPPGLVITIDGQEKAEVLWSSGVAVDPGSRIVEATAPGKKKFGKTVAIERAGIFDVALSLDEAPAPADDALESDDARANRARRTTGYVVGGVGIAVLAAGVASGVAAVVNNNAAERCGSPCYRDQPDGKASDEATDRALTFANVANVTVPLGVLGVLAGAYLAFTAGPVKRASILPRASASAAGFEVTGLW